jgi:hypothetical protein
MDNVLHIDVEGGTVVVASLPTVIHCYNPFD